MNPETKRRTLKPKRPTRSAGKPPSRGDVALGRSEERFRSLFENSPIALLEEDISGVKAGIDAIKAEGVTDLPSYIEEHPEILTTLAATVKVLDVNNTALKMFRAGSKEELFSSFSRVFGKETLETFKKGLKTVFDGRLLCDAETVNYSLSGDRLNVYVKWIVLPGHEKDYSRILVSMMDITPLRKAEEYVRNVLDTVDEGFIVIDREFNITSANRAFLKQVGLDMARVVGSRCHKVSHGSDKPCHEDGQDCAAVRTFETGEPDGALHIHWKADGEPMFAEVRTYPLMDFEGNVTSVIETVLDVTERKRMEDRLMDAELRYRTLFEKSPYGVVVVDPTTTLPIEFNEAAHEMLGYTREEFARLRIEDYDTGETPEEIRAGVKRVLGTGWGEFEVMHRTKHGDARNVFIYAQALDLGGKKVLYTIRLDVTEKKKMEEELIRSQKLDSVGLLAGGIAHDFNNLLMGVLGTVSLAKMASEPGGRAYAMLEESERALNRTKSLTQQLLTFSKGGSPVKKVIDLRQVLEDQVRFALSGSNVRSEISIPDDLRPVEADEGQINQVIQNIVMNAVEAMPTGGTVFVNAENVSVGPGFPLREGEYVRISVRDTGHGIPPEHMTRVFDPYFSTKKKGSGLGLATAYSIISKHCGLLDAESTLGLGSCFHIYLPASERGEPPPEKTRAELMKGSGRVLVMDDEEVVRMVAGEMLRTLGYRVETASDAEEAVSRYRIALDAGDPFDLVILDLTVRGGMGGLDALRKLVAVDPDIKAIVSSGYADDPVMSDYARHGFKAVLAKPYKIDDMSRVLAELKEAD